MDRFGSPLPGPRTHTEQIGSSHRSSWRCTPVGSELEDAADRVRAIQSYPYEALVPGTGPDLIDRGSVIAAILGR